MFGHRVVVGPPSSAWSAMWRCSDEKRPVAHRVRRISPQCGAERRQFERPGACSANTLAPASVRSSLYSEARSDELACANSSTVRDPSACGRSACRTSVRVTAAELALHSSGQSLCSPSTALFESIRLSARAAVAAFVRAERPNGAKKGRLRSVSSPHRTRDAAQMNVRLHRPGVHPPHVPMRTSLHLFW